MNATTNRLPLSRVPLGKRNAHLIATLSLFLLATGCRSAQRLGSLVQVTEDPAAQVADVPALEQRLATTKTTAGATSVTRAKAPNNATQPDSTSAVAGMPKIFQDKNVAQTAGTTARLSDSDLPLTETRNTNVATRHTTKTKTTRSATTANKDAIARAEAIAAKRSATKMQLTDSKSPVTTQSTAKTQSPSKTQSSKTKSPVKTAAKQAPAQKVASKQPVSKPVSGSLSDLPQVSVRLPESMVIERAIVNKSDASETTTALDKQKTAAEAKNNVAAVTAPTKTATAKAKQTLEESSKSRAASKVAKTKPSAPSVTQSKQPPHVSKPDTTELVAQSAKAPTATKPVSSPQSAESGLVAARATDLTLPKAAATPTVSRKQIAQTHQPLPLEAALRSRLNRLPKLGTQTASSTGPAPQRIGSNATAATTQIARNETQSVPPKVAEPHHVASGRVGDIAKDNVIVAEEVPSRILNANQIRPASHAQRGSEMQVTKTASARLPASPDRASTLPAQTARLTDSQSVSPGNKLDQLSEAQLYQQLLGRLSTPAENETPLEKERRLIVARHLMVLAGDPNAATQAMEGLNSTEQRYMKNQLLGLWTMIDPKGHPSSGRRITEALPKFREATRYMAAATDSLTLKHLEFCTEIESYGQIKPFEGNRFVAGQQVILYCEVENFAAAPIQNAFQTKLQGTYDIYNEKGVKVVSQLLPVDQQQSRNQLRDYFVAYQMSLPKQLAKGTYRLQLTIEDAIGKKYGQANIPFEIK